MPAEQSRVAGGEWRRSRSCVGDGHCVELAVTADGAQVWMRNSTSPETVLVFDAGEYAKFLDAIKTGEFPLTN